MRGEPWNAQADVGMTIRASMRHVPLPPESWPELGDGDAEDDEGATDTSDRVAIVEQQLRSRAEGGAERHEDEGEAQHEQDRVNERRTSRARDVVEPIFDLRRELIVHHIGKRRDQRITRCLAQRRR